MFDQFERELLPKEKRFLSSKIQHWRRRIRKGSWNVLIFWLVICGVSSLLIFLPKNQTHKPEAFACTLVIFAIIALWAGMSSEMDMRKRITQLERTVASNRAVVTRIVADQMVEFEEIEDEGACYAFQVSDDKIAFVVGQDYYPSAKFPNSDFDLIDIGPEESIEKRGQKLVPIRRISAKVKETLQIPDHLALISGKLEKLEDLLRLPEQ